MGYDEASFYQNIDNHLSPSRLDRRRYATPFTNKLNGSSRRPTVLMSCSSMSNNNK
jgi:hypothetical protein